MDKTDMAPNYQGGSYKAAVDGTSGNQVVNRQ